MAAPGEILVSATVLDLVGGSGLAFEDAGRHELKGISGRDSSLLIDRSPGSSKKSPSSATVVIKRFMIIACGNRLLCPQLVPGG
ncbi:MAG TPA: hypothetical protein VF086_16895 [Propionibacteriaceae bacterium]